MSSSVVGRPEIQRRDHMRSAQNRASTVVITALLAVMACYFLFPIVWLLISSTKDQQSLLAVGVLSFAKPFSLFHNIATLSTFRGGQYWRWYANTVMYSAVISIISCLFSAMVGYVLTKYKFRGRNVVYWTILASIMIPGAVTVIPLFILERALGLMDTYLAVILPQLVNPFGAFFMSVYIGGVLSDELLEAARIDGAGDFRIFFRIVLPVIQPGVVTLLLIVFIGAWNNFFLPFLVLSKTTLFPLTVGLSSWLSEIGQNGQSGIDWYSLVITGAALSILPMLILFPFLSRYIASGLSQGSLKV